VSVHARVTVPLRLDELESHFKRGGDENDVVADLMARDRIVVGRRERGRGTGITLRDPQPSQPRRIESDLTKVLERRTSGPPTCPPNLSFMDACLLNCARRFLSTRSTPYRFANALSLSRENTAEEPYLARGKSFQDKQERGVDDSTNHDQRGDAQKSSGVPY